VFHLDLFNLKYEIKELENEYKKVLKEKNKLIIKKLNTKEIDIILKDISDNIQNKKFNYTKKNIAIKYHHIMNAYIKIQNIMMMKKK
jgi:hypothetical protein